MDILVESMTKILSVDGYIIRVWREEADISEKHENSDLYCAVHSHQAKKAQNGDVICMKPKELIKELLLLDRVNAVEIVDKGGAGTVVYNSWP